jgi:aryl-alcohol dehydrogenase-like predicted oxidoreductase
MRRSRLGDALDLSIIGLGAWVFGGGGMRHGFGPQPDQDSMATIQRALDVGINWIDTAPVYGLGHSETVIGRALAGRPEVLVATKFGLTWAPGKSRYRRCLEPASIVQELEASLRRLGRERIDLYQLHWPAGGGDLEAAWSAVAALAAQGKLRCAGLCNVNEEQIARLQTIYPIASVQLPYNMIERGAGKRLFGFCARQGIGVLAYAPLRAGLLSGEMTAARAAQLPADDWRSRTPDFHPPLLEVNLELVERLRELATELDTSAAALALAWVLCREEVSAVIVGARCAAQIAETARAATLELPAAAVERIAGWLGARDRAARALRSRAKLR